MGTGDVVGKKIKRFLSTQGGGGFIDKVLSVPSNTGNKGLQSHW